MKLISELFDVQRVCTMYSLQGRLHCFIWRTKTNTEPKIAHILYTIYIHISAVRKENGNFHTLHFAYIVVAGRMCMCGTHESIYGSISKDDIHIKNVTKRSDIHVHLFDMMGMGGFYSQTIFLCCYT